MKFNIGNSPFQNLDIFAQFTYARIAVEAKKAAHFAGFMAMVNCWRKTLLIEVNRAYSALVILLSFYLLVLIYGNAKLFTANFKAITFPVLILLPFANLSFSLARGCKSTLDFFSPFTASVDAFADFALRCHSKVVRFVFVKIGKRLIYLAGRAILLNTTVSHSLILLNVFRLWLGRAKSYLVRPFLFYHKLFTCNSVFRFSCLMHESAQRDCRYPAQLQLAAV